MSGMPAALRLLSRLVIRRWDPPALLSPQCLGYEDGEEMSFDELFYVVSRIKTVSELPLSVDLEAGYGATTSHIIDNIRRLAHLGVSGNKSRG
ncbi:carboxyvinyl-carboxyphosphonate phosphorylmutase [Klebsiella pneumoniae]|nr:carboxyvinyl-carboxyphosphonate phosphorylmutase [Klebsiella pneumoniae]